MPSELVVPLAGRWASEPMRMNRSPLTHLEAVRLAAASVTAASLTREESLIEMPTRQGEASSVSMACPSDGQSESVHSVEIVAWVATCWVLPCDVTAAPAP